VLFRSCISFYSYKDVEKLEKFLQGKAVSEQEIGRQLLNDIVSFSETSVCRRKFILHYFGEDYDVKACDEKCDNCANPKEKFEGKELVQKLLKTVLALNQKHKSNHIADVVAGQLNNEITNYKHNHLEVFGIGKDRDTNSWNSIIRQAVLQEFIRKEVESYGIIKVTQKGQDFLKNPKSVSFFKERDYSDLSGPIIQDSKNTVVDENLFVLLKELTKQVSKEKQIPPFAIFQQPSLQEMCLYYPLTMEELKNISGVGNGKAKRFGQPFLDIIAKYVNENDIERPSDFVVKSVANKSALKIHIITSIDKKSNLEDIASQNNIKFNELITEIETIVNSGTKINLNYFIDEMLGEEEQEEIFDYFMEAESDSIDAAYEEFEEEYEEEELRLMRIKFLSEVAN
jgi:ATP-dependent DNA helicase RecQ